MVMTHCEQLLHLFDSPVLDKKLKLWLYKIAVYSLLMCGCETWVWTDKVLRQLNGANSTMLTHITDQSVSSEAHRVTTSHDLIRHIRVMRLKWLGFILREPESRLIVQTVKAQRDLYKSGSILMDTPSHKNFQDLILKAKDKDFWDEHIKFI